MTNSKTIISNQNPRADFHLARALSDTIYKYYTGCQHFVFFCIGTPKVSGDTLGPAIGSQLKQLNLPGTAVYGTEKSPVHALNLGKKWEEVKKKHPDSCFIAIDASFGPRDLLGSICVDTNPIYPGRGVGKCLPPVGDFSITSIVCADCQMRHQQLQKIPQRYISTQANIIVHGIFQSLLFHFLKEKIL